MQPHVPVVNCVIMIENSRRSTWYRRRSYLWPGVLAVIIVVPLLLVLFGTWDWFIPFVDARASAAIGRQVGMQHLHARLGRITTITAEGVHIANPTGFSSPEASDTTNFAQADQLVVQVDVWRYLRGGGLFLPEIAVHRPVIAAIGTADGATNYLLSLAAPTGETGAADNTASTPQINRLVITDGTARIRIAKMRADVDATIATQELDGTPKIVVTAKGRYAGQPVDAHFIGDGLLSLELVDRPYEVDTRLQNGATKLHLWGTVQQPLEIRGADLKLDLVGTDMAALYPLTSQVASIMRRGASAFAISSETWATATWREPSPSILVASAPILSPCCIRARSTWLIWEGSSAPRPAAPPRAMPHRSSVSRWRRPRPIRG